MARTRPLPAPRSRFVGRADELDALDRIVGHDRLVSLVGPGGCGKTRLALEVLGRRSSTGHRDDLPGDRPDETVTHVIQLASVGRTDDVAAAFLDGLGERDDPLRDPVEQIVDALLATTGPSADLAPPAIVVLVDNAEHLIEPVAALVDTLLERIDRLSIVVTSREPLGVAGEAVYRVPPMALPSPDRSAGELRAYDSVALFLDRATLARPGSPLHDDDLPAIAEICRRLDGLPLAVELAAARLNLLAPERIADGLRDRFRLLVTGNRTALPRHRTLEACIDWSYSLLSQDERRLLDRLSVFRGPFTLDGCVAVAQGVIAADVVFELMDRLVSKSLVVADPRPDGTRFRLLDSVAAFAAHRLDAGGAVSETRFLLAAHVDALTEPSDQELTGAEQDRLLRRLRDNEDNIRAALEHLTTTAETSEAVTTMLWRVLGRLTFFWLSAGRFREARAWFAAASNHPPPDPRASLAAQWGAAHLATYAGDFDVAASQALATLARAEELGDDRWAGRALDTLGSMECVVDPERGMATLARAIELAERASDSWCQTDARQVLAYIHLLRHEHHEAEGALDAAVDTARALDHPLLLAWDALGRATIAIDRGRLPDAAAALADARHQVGRTTDPNLTALVIGADALAALLAGRGPMWIDPLEQALLDGQRTEAGLSFPTVVADLVRVLVDHGDVDRAREVIGTHLEVVVALAPAHAGRLLAIAAAVDLASGDVPTAEARIATATSSASCRADQALIALTAALVALQRGDPGRAESTAAPALETLAELDLRPAVIDAVELLALVHATNGDRVVAHRFIGAARSERRRLGVVRTELQTLLAPLLATALGSPGSGDEIAAGLAGEAATVEDVIGSVRRSRGERRRPSIGWASLTPTERRVAELVADGCSTAAAAERLFVTPATVKTHLAHIYRKLDIANRAELASTVVANTSAAET